MFGLNPPVETIDLEESSLIGTGILFMFLSLGSLLGAEKIENKELSLKEDNEDEIK